MMRSTANKNSENLTEETTASSTTSNSFAATAWRAYTSAPINFSTLTGWRYPGIPRLRGNPFLGRLDMMQGESLLPHLIEIGRLASRHPSGMCYFWMGPQLIFFVTKPEHIQEVLVKNQKNTSRKLAAYPFKLFFGPNIISDSDELWTKTRGVYRDFLHKKEALRESEIHMRNSVITALRTLPWDSEQIIDCRDFLRNFLTNSAVAQLTGHCLSGTEEVVEVSKYIDAIEKEVLSPEKFLKWQIPATLRSLLYRGQENNAKVVASAFKNQFKKMLIDPNSSTLEEKENFLQRIGKLRGAVLPLDGNEDVLGDGSAFLLAAYSSTLAVSQFVIKLLAANPNVEEKLRKEIYQHCPPGQELSIESVNKIEYLEMVIKETLRLYPPAPVTFPRTVEQSFSVGGEILSQTGEVLSKKGITLDKGVIVFAAPYLTHRLEEFWGEHPEQFNPERFSKENWSNVNRNRFIPFGAGQHECVGQKFAFQGLKFLLAGLYRRYHLEIENNDLSIQMIDGIIKPTVPPRARFIPINPSLRFQDKDTADHSRDYSRRLANSR